MKRIVLIGVLILMLTAFAGCGKKETVQVADQNGDGIYGRAYNVG